MNLRRLFLYLLITSVALSALIGIGVILLGDFGNIEIRVLFTTLTVTVTSIFGLACGASLESGRGKYLPTAGIVLSIVSAVICFSIIWNIGDGNEIFVKIFVTGTILAAACSHLSLLSLARLDRRFSWTRPAALICAALLVVILLYIIWFEPYGESDLIYRVLAVLGILLASMTVLTPILHRLSAGDPSVDVIDKEIERLRRRLSELEAERAALQPPEK
jgi:hypothetical protein